jgi:hypothetical protein
MVDLRETVNKQPTKQVVENDWTKMKGSIQ